MGIFKINKTLNRIDKMIDNAMEGKNITDAFDESKLSALETKFANYLNANGTTKQQLLDEKKNVNQYISDISHQTKTPMANILLYTQLLGEHKLSEESKRLLAEISNQTEKLNFLISSLVKASRLETGIIAVNPQTSNTNSLLRMVVSQISSKAKEKNIEIETNIRDINAVFDNKWTAEAIYNVVDNAVKYSPCYRTITISNIEYQMFCRIDITDRGIGIHEDEISKIFARFYRSTEVSQVEGVGIGLYLSREIIAKQGGYIKVKSEIGNGSTFSVFLPKE
ncbi:MAG: HAMP domain-containing sensor histidine kinase [Oscillospiraceae bacterium]